MLMIPLVVVVFSVTGVICVAPFNFRGNCYVTHIANTFSAKCDGTSRLINTKDLFLDNRTTASMTDMELKNFQSITLESSVQINKIKINNTKRVSLYISNTNLKYLVIESVDVLTLKYKNSDDSITRKLDSMVLLNVNQLQLINEGGEKFLWPINKVEISNVYDFSLDSLNLHITATNVSFKNTNIRFKSQSALLLEAVSATLTSGYIYIHDDGYFSIKVFHFSVEDSKIDVENGALQLINSNNVVFSKNSFYGFQNKSSFLNDNSNVKLIDNEILTNDIAHFLSLKSEHLIFVDNTFGCTDCNVKNKLLALDLKDVGDTNYCYTDCKLSLNKYKSLLTSYCICSNSEAITNFSLMCAPCSLKNETVSEQTIIGVDNLKFIIFTFLAVFVIITFSCCICYKDNIYKFKSQQLECDRSSSKTVIYRKSRNDDDDNDSCENIYELIDVPPNTRQS